MSPEAKKRLKWIQVYEATGHAGKTCLKCGISRPTLRKWLRRYESEGLTGFEEGSRRPRRFPNQKISAQHEQWIMEFRKVQLEARRIQSELLWRHECKLSLATIHKVLKCHRECCVMWCADFWTSFDLKFGRP